jgi:hypothetical protein
MKKFANPNFLYILTFIIPFLVYSLGWSKIYPVLSSELFTFYIITFIIAFVLAIVIDRLPGYVYKPIPVFQYNGVVIFLLYIFYIFDCLYSGFIPLLAIISGKLFYIGNLTFGIPTLHVIAVTFNIFFALHLFHQYISSRSLKSLLMYLSALMPFIFLIQRSSIMYIIMGSVFIFFIAQKKVVFKKIFVLVLFALSILYLFGYLGNVRSGNGDPTFIPRASGATDKFLEGSVPLEFYWGYLYIASPVANLQNNINIETNVDPDYKGFIVFEMFPDIATKRIAEAFSLERREFNQINSFLNTGTIYARPFSFLSWKGMYIIFFYLIGLMNLYYLVIRRSYMFGPTGLAIMFTVIALANFENSLWFSTYSLPLLYPLVLSIIRNEGLNRSIKIARQKGYKKINV